MSLRFAFIFNQYDKSPAFLDPNLCTLYSWSKKEKEKKNTYLIQCKLSYRDETGTNQHGLLSTLV